MALVLLALLLVPQQRTIVDPDRLPRPYSGPKFLGVPKLVPAPGDDFLKGPSGFKIRPYARFERNPRWLAVAPNGDVFVTLSYSGQIWVLRDADQDGKAEGKFLFAQDLHLPHGMSFQDDSLYVGNTDAVVRFDYKTGQVKAIGAPETIVGNVPGNGRRQHWTRNILFEPDGKHFFLTVGSAANKAVESPPRATIQRYSTDGKTRETFATGIRNPVGIAFRPGTRE
ncbi:sorbosone dehydrogenase family protein, partial [bacterium]